MRFLRIVPFLAVLAVILFAGLKPDPVPQSFDQQDKLHHLLGFAALAFTLRFAWPNGRLRWALLFSLAVALLIEVAQGYQPHRVASLGDMLANAAGVLLGIGCAVVGVPLAEQPGGEGSSFGRAKSFFLICGVRAWDPPA